MSTFFREILQRIFLPLAAAITPVIATVFPTYPLPVSQIIRVVMPNEVDTHPFQDPPVIPPPHGCVLEWVIARVVDGTERAAAFSRRVRPQDPAIIQRHSVAGELRHLVRRPLTPEEGP